MRPCVSLHDLARDRQAEAGAGDAALTCIGPEELREDPRVVLLGHAEPLVPDLDVHDARGGLAQHLDDAPVRRVLHRVLEQVREHLGEAVPVAAHGQRGRAHHDLEPVLRRLVGHQPDLLHDHRPQVDRPVLKLDPARVDALAVEELVDQRGEAVALLLDDLEVPVAVVLLEIARPSRLV